MTAIPIPLIAGAEIASNVMVASIKALYGTAKSINDFLNDHIEEMKAAENPTVARTGRVLEMAKYGFGVGYITPVVVIATGQLLLGNSMAAITTAATAATLTNPIAMTCAAVGAIYYGWSALSDQEKNEILEKLSHGLEIGIEFIKSVIRFVTEKTKELLSKENLEEIKKHISKAAHVFGKTLGEVTHKIGDVVGDTFDILKKKTGDAIDKTADLVSDACVAMKEQGGKAAELASDTYDSVKEQSGKVVERVKSKKSNNVAETKHDSFGDNEIRLE